MTETRLALRIRSPRNRDPRGQALIEFAMVLPLLVLIMLGVMQFGLLFWTQITLTQVSRDTGRWVASQTWECDAALDPVAANAAVAAQANLIADRSTLFGWGSSNQLTVSELTWTEKSRPASDTGPPDCPPVDNTYVWNVTFQINHTVPVFMPMLADSGCPSCRAMQSEVQFRVEPAP